MSWLGDNAIPRKALVLGTGGASKSVCYILSILGIQPSVVSRYRKRDYTYDELTGRIIQDHHLIINTTPLGMEPDTQTLPDIPYQALTSGHWLFDLVYNPINTLFLTRGQQQGAKTKNGLEMLYLQAELAWSIWQTYDKF
jgi:shikimate dehydrogenase